MLVEAKLAPAVQATVHAAIWLEAPNVNAAAMKGVARAGQSGGSI